MECPNKTETNTKSNSISLFHNESQQIQAKGRLEPHFKSISHLSARHYYNSIINTNFSHFELIQMIVNEVTTTQVIDFFSVEVWFCIDDYSLQFLFVTVIHSDLRTTKHKGLDWQLMYYLYYLHTHA